MSVTQQSRKDHSDGKETFKTTKWKTLSPPLLKLINWLIVCLSGREWREWFWCDDDVINGTFDTRRKALRSASHCPSGTARSGEQELATTSTTTSIAAQLPQLQRTATCTAPAASTTQWQRQPTRTIDEQQWRGTRSGLLLSNAHHSRKPLWWKLGKVVEPCIILNLSPAYFYLYIWTNNVHHHQRWRQCHFIVK